MVPLMTLWASCDINASASSITWPKKSCCTTYWSSWPAECNGTIDDAVGIMWCQCQWQHMTKESHVTSHFYHLDLRNRIVSLMILWHYVTLVPASMTSNDQKFYVVHCVNHLALMNAVVLLTMTLAPHGADASSNSVNDWKVMLHLVSIISTIQTKWCNLKCHKCHVILALVPTATRLKSCHTFFQMPSPSK